MTAHGATAGFVVTLPVPLLDHAGVEAARLAQAAHAVLVAEQPSVTYALLAEARNQNEPAVRQWVRRLRLAGRLVTVEGDGRTLLPSFQFDEAYEPIPEVGAVVARLTSSGLSAWAVWRWFTVVDPWIEEPPVDLVRAGRFEELDQLATRLVGDDDR